MSSSHSYETKDLTQGPIGKQIIFLALPIIGTSFIQIAYSFTDMAWIGRLGSKELAAVSVVAVLIWFANSVGLLVKTGAEVCVAQGVGAKDRDKARSYAAHNSTLALYLALGLNIVFQVFGSWIIGLYELPPDVSAMALKYFRIVFLGLPFLFLSFVYSGIYTAVGRSNVSFWINSIGLIVNILLDPLFIFVFDWGIEGAAWATNCAEVLVVGLFYYKIKVKDKLLDGWALMSKLKREETQTIVRLGLPIVLLNCIFALITLIMGTFASKTGGHIGVATINAGGQLEAISWNTSQGFGTALTAFVAQNYAAKDYQRIFSAYHICILITSAFGILASLFYFFYGTELFALIVPEKEAYIEGGIYLRIAAYSQIFMMLEITSKGIFYGVGRTTLPAIISIIGNLLRIPLVFLLIFFGLGLSGVWWAISISSILKGIASLASMPYIRRKIVETSLQTQTQQ